MAESHECNYVVVTPVAPAPTDRAIPDHDNGVASGRPRQGVPRIMTKIDDDMLHPRELEENWQDDANCLGVDPDLFFPERGASTREAKEVCRGCVVREQCLEFALQNGEKFGIWGGMSERERRRIRRQRALARAAAAAQASSVTA